MLNYQRVMNLSENHLCSPCFPCFLGSRNWSNKNGPFHPSPISLLVASHTWPAPSIAPRKKPSNWECWWSQWNRIVFLIFHTDIELEIMMQLMIIIIVLIYHIYMIIYVWYMYEKIQLQFPLVTGFLPRCHQGSLCVPRRFPGWTRHSPPVKNGYS